MVFANRKASYFSVNEKQKYSVIVKSDTSELKTLLLDGKVYLSWIKFVNQYTDDAVHMEY